MIRIKKGAGKAASFLPKLIAITLACFSATFLDAKPSPLYKKGENGGNVICSLNQISASARKVDAITELTFKAGSPPETFYCRSYFEDTLGNILKKLTDEYRWPYVRLYSYLILDNRESELIDKNQFEIDGETGSWNSSQGWDYEDNLQERLTELKPGKYKFQIIRRLLVNLKTPHPLTGILRWEETSEEVEIMSAGMIDITVLPE